MRNINRSKQRREQRQENAATREAERAKKSAKQQLKRLDVLLGKDVGAKRERARLIAQIPKNTEKKTK